MRSTNLATKALGKKLAVLVAAKAKPRDARFKDQDVSNNLGEDLPTLQTIKIAVALAVVLDQYRSVTYYYKIHGSNAILAPNTQWYRARNGFNHVNVNLALVACEL
jgi:hypothetical protein